MVSSRIDPDIQAGIYKHMVSSMFQYLDVRFRRDSMTDNATLNLVDVEQPSPNLTSGTKSLRVYGYSKDPTVTGREFTGMYNMMYSTKNFNIISKNITRKLRYNKQVPKSVTESITTQPSQSSKSFRQPQIDQVSNTVSVLPFDQPHHVFQHGDVTREISDKLDVVMQPSLLESSKEEQREVSHSNNKRRRSNSLWSTASEDNTGSNVTLQSVSHTKLNECTTCCERRERKQKDTKHRDVDYYSKYLNNDYHDDDHDDDNHDDNHVDSNDNKDGSCDDAYRLHLVLADTDTMVEQHVQGELQDKYTECLEYVESEVDTELVTLEVPDVDKPGSSLQVHNKEGLQEVELVEMNNYHQGVRIPYQYKCPRCGYCSEIPVCQYFQTHNVKQEVDPQVSRRCCLQSKGTLVSSFVSDPSQGLNQKGTGCPCVVSDVDSKCYCHCSRIRLVSESGQQQMCDQRCSCRCLPDRVSQSSYQEKSLCCPLMNQQLNQLNHTKSCTKEEQNRHCLCSKCRNHQCLHEVQKVSGVLPQTESCNLNCDCSSQQLNEKLYTPSTRYGQYLPMKNLNFQADVTEMDQTFNSKVQEQSIDSMIAQYIKRPYLEYKNTTVYEYVIIKMLENKYKPVFDKQAPELYDSEDLVKYPEVYTFANKMFYRFRYRGIETVFTTGLQPYFTYQQTLPITLNELIPAYNEYVALLPMHIRSMLSIYTSQLPVRSASSQHTTVIGGHNILLPCKQNTYGLNLEMLAVLDHIIAVTDVLHNSNLILTRSMLIDMILRRHLLIRSKEATFITHSGTCVAGMIVSVMIP